MKYLVSTNLYYIYTRARRAVQGKKSFRLGQYKFTHNNNNNKRMTRFSANINHYFTPFQIVTLPNRWRRPQVLLADLCAQNAAACTPRWTTWCATARSVRASSTCAAHCVASGSIGATTTNTISWPSTKLWIHGTTRNIVSDTDGQRVLLSLWVFFV